MNASKTEVQLRWMIRRDHPAVMEIDRGCFEPFQWSDDDLLQFLKQRNCIGMIAEHQDRVVGMMVYELHKSELRLLRFAVSPFHWREGIGRAMFKKLVGKLAQQKRSRFYIDVRESNLQAQVFFRLMGLKATKVLRNHFPDRGEDAYRMVYSLQD